MKTLYKQYEGSLDLGVEFSANLASGETLASGADIDVLVASHGVIGDLTVASVQISGTQVVARFSDGTCLKLVRTNRYETSYVLRVKVTTSSGEVESELVELIVYDAVERA